MRQLIVTAGTTFMTFITVTIFSLDNLGRITVISVISCLLAAFLLAIRNTELKVRLHQNTFALDIVTETFTAGENLQFYQNLLIGLGFLSLLPVSLYFLLIQNFDSSKNLLVENHMSNMDKNLIISIASHVFSNILQLG